MRGVWAVAAVLCMMGWAWGDYLPWDDEQLVGKADTIVLGTVEKITPTKPVEMEKGEAEVAIKEVLKGTVKEGRVSVPFLVLEDDWYPEAGTYVFFLSKDGEGFRLVHLNDSVSAKVTPAELEGLRGMIWQDANAERYRKLYETYRGLVAEAVKKEDKEELARITDKFRETSGGKLNEALISKWKGERTEHLFSFSKTYGEGGKKAEIKHGRWEKVYVSRVNDFVQVETGKKADGTYDAEDGVFITLIFQGEGKTELEKPGRWSEVKMLAPLKLTAEQKAKVDEWAGKQPHGPLVISAKDMMNFIWTILTDEQKPAWGEIMRGSKSKVAPTGTGGRKEAAGTEAAP